MFLKLSILFVNLQVKTICKEFPEQNFSKMKNFLELKLSVLLLLVSMGMLANPVCVEGQVIVSNVYEQGDVPQGPGKLNAVPLYHSLIKLDWIDHSNNESGFHVYMRDKYRNQYRLLFDVPKNKTTAYVWELEEETEYYFYVVAYNQYGNSGSSNIANSTTPYSYPHGTPAAPTNLEIYFQNGYEAEIGWEDNSNDEFGFKIARQIAGEPFFEIIDSVQSDVLTYREVGLEPDRIYIYKVCAYNEHGFSAYTNTVSVNTSNNNFEQRVPQLVEKHNILKGNYPNPFNPSTLIEFSLTNAVNVKLTVYNALGEEVTIVSNSFLQPGNYLYEWNGSDYSSGVYFYKLEAGSFTDIRKMMLIK